VGQEAGDEAVGKLLEGLVDLGFELGKGGRVLGQLLGPGLLLGGELSVDLGKGLIRRRDIGPGLGVEVEAHGKSFRVKPPHPHQNSDSAPRRRPFSGMDPRKFRSHISAAYN